MPTLDELIELRTHTSYRRTDEYGKAGWKWVSKTGTAAVMFHPMSGRWSGGSLEYEDIYGIYRTSTPAGEGYAYEMENSTGSLLQQGARWVAESVRGVLPRLMGGGWRMPTKAECEELIDNTERNPADGPSRFTSVAYPWKRIYLRMGGGYVTGDGTLVNKGKFAYFWSASSYVGSDTSGRNTSWHFGFDGLNEFVLVVNRFCAQSVRGVLFRIIGACRPTTSVRSSYTTPRIRGGIMG